MVQTVAMNSWKLTKKNNIYYEREEHGRINYHSYRWVCFMKLCVNLKIDISSLEITLFPREAYAYLAQYLV